MLPSNVRRLRAGLVAQHARQAVALSLQLAERMSQGAMLRQAIDSAGFVCVMVDNGIQNLSIAPSAGCCAACLRRCAQGGGWRSPGNGFRNGDQAIASVGKPSLHRRRRGTDACDEHCRRELLHDSGRARRRLNGQSFRSSICRLRPGFCAAAFRIAPRSMCNTFAWPWIARGRRRRLPRLSPAGIRRLESRRTEESP